MAQEAQLWALLPFMVLPMLSGSAGAQLPLAAVGRPPNADLKGGPLPGVRTRA